MIFKIILSSTALYFITLGQDLAHLSISTSSNDSYSVEKYFPLDTEVNYLFDTNFGDVEAFMEWKDEEIFITYETSGIFYQQSYISKSDGIYVTSSKNEILFFGNDVKYSEPVLRFPKNLKQGMTWAWDGFEIVNEEDTVSLSVKGKVVGYETVSTELGDLSCVKIESIFTEYGTKTNYLTEWLAPQIGIVKAEAVLKGDGFAAWLQEFLGFDQLYFDLIEINN